MAGILWLESAIDDLRRIGPDAAVRVLKKVRILEQDPMAGQPLGGDLTGYRKLVVGKKTWRIVYRLQDEEVQICEVWAVGLRSDSEVYDEASKRAATIEEPRFVAMKELVYRLGMSAGIEMEPPPEQREPVPRWLAARLIYTAGMRPEQVAAMGAEEAFEAWNAYMMKGNASG